MLLCKRVREQQADKVGAFVLLCVLVEVVGERVSLVPEKQQMSSERHSVCEALPTNNSP